MYSNETDGSLTCISIVSVIANTHTLIYSVSGIPVFTTTLYNEWVGGEGRGGGGGGGGETHG